MRRPLCRSRLPDPSRKMMRQIAGAFAEYEKARLVHKLRHARERQRKERGKCEGRKAHSELRPEVVAEAKRLRRASPKTGERLSYRQISARLAEAGFLAVNTGLDRGGLRRDGGPRYTKFRYRIGSHSIFQFAAPHRHKRPRKC